MSVSATAESYDTLTRSGAVLVDFWGPRCAPCLAMMPRIEELERSTGGRVRVVKVNAQENPDICRQTKVMTLPTILLLQDGDEVARMTRDITDAQLTDAFAQLQSTGTSNREEDRQ